MRSKQTTLPVARETVARYVLAEAKLPWLIDLLNVNLGNEDLDAARERLTEAIEAFTLRGTRTTANLDFDAT